MSKENVKLFYEKAAKDKNLRKEINNLYTQHQEELLKSITKLGSEAGFEFSKEDVNKLAKGAISAVQRNGELSDEQMEAIIGGCSDNITPPLRPVPWDDSVEGELFDYYHLPPELRPSS